MKEGIGNLWFLMVVRLLDKSLPASVSHSRPLTLAMVSVFFLLAFSLLASSARAIDCYGDATICESFISDETCIAQEGCGWTPPADSAPSVLYHSDEGNVSGGTVLVDALDHYNATVAGDSLSYGDGVSGLAAYYNGSSEADTGFTFSSMASAMTVDVWIKPDALPTVSQMTIVSDHDWSTQSGFILGIGDDGSASCSAVDAAWMTAKSGTDNVTAGGWTHLVCVWDGTYLRLYVNDTLEATSDATAGDGLLDSGTSWTTTIIEKDCPYTDYVLPFIGFMDEVNITSTINGVCGGEPTSCDAFNGNSTGCEAQSGCVLAVTTTTTTTTIPTTTTTVPVTTTILMPTGYVVSGSVFKDVLVPLVLVIMILASLLAASQEGFSAENMIKVVVLIFIVMAFIVAMTAA